MLASLLIKFAYSVDGFCYSWSCLSQAPGCDCQQPSEQEDQQHSCVQEGLQQTLVPVETEVHESVQLLVGSVCLASCTNINSVSQWRHNQDC